MYQHIPVLLNEVLEALQPAPGKVYIDGTLGGGGHATLLLQQSQPNGKLLGIDADPAALQAAHVSFEEHFPSCQSGSWRFVHGNFAEIASIAHSYGFDSVDGILFDLGVSSHQLDTPERGFSFAQEGPLDMRLDPTTETTAADVIAHMSEQDLADSIYRYGEERFSRQIARRIVAYRNLHTITTTTELADLVAQVIQRRKGRSQKIHGQKRYTHIHPATRTFQALRITVNNELDHLERALSQAVDVLRPGGRVAVISFHSLEDRIVKLFFRAESGYGGNEAEGRPIRLRIVTKKPIVAQEHEVCINPRSRSAKLRVAERV